MIEPNAKAADITIMVNKTSDYSERAPGQTITFDIQYSYSSITVDGVNVRVTDLLPEGLEYIDHSTSGSAHIDHVEITDDGGRDLVTFYFFDPLPSGSTGVLKVMTRFVDGVTPDGTSVENTAEMSADGADPVNSSVTVTANTNDPDWSITKTKTSPQANPVPGQPVTYRITLHGNSSGGLNMHDVRIEDRLPADVTDVTPAGGGVYDSGTGIVTWDIGDLNVGATVTRDITFTYPESTYNTSTTAVNNADGYGQPYGDTTEISVTDDVTHGFSAPVPTVENFRKSNRQGVEEYSIGQTAIYEIDNFGLNGNVPLEDFYIEDAIPSELDLTAITTGRTSTGQDVTITYQSNDTTGWQPWTTAATSTNTNLPVSGLALAPGDYITDVRWYFGNVPLSFNDSDDIRLYATVLAIDKADGVTPVTEVTNTAYLYWEYSGTEYSDNDDAYFVTTGQRPWFNPSKTVLDNTLNYGDTVNYTLRLGNHSYATGTLSNPIAIDVLPIYIDPDDGSYFDVLEDISWGWNAGNTGLTGIADPHFLTDTVTIDGRTRTVLKWEFNDPAVVLLPGQYINITLSGDIKNLTNTGVFTNQMYMTTNSTDDIKDLAALVDDDYDLDQDSDNTDKLYPVSRDVFVQFQGSLESDKWVKGELDSAFTQYEDPGDGVGHTLPGGIADYQLHVRNHNSNGPITNMVIIDVLPRIGDTGLLDTSDRETVWVPYLVDHITGENGAALPAGVTVYYSTNPNPSLTELYDPEHDDGSPGDLWSATPPADITTVKSIKIDFGATIFDPGDTIIVEWPMRAPIGAPVGEIAWNSFAYTATYPGYSNGSEVNQPFLPAEPTKVGFEVMAPTSNVELGNFVWHDLDADGVQDAGEEGINGVKVNLYRSDQTPGVDAPIAFTRSGDHHSGIPGYYGFPDLPAGSYIVEFIYPDSYYLSPEHSGADAVDSDGLSATATSSGGFVRLNTGVINLNSDNIDIDLGLYLPAALGDKVWYDIDSDGVQDAGEGPVAGVEVNLTDSSGHPVNDIDGVAISSQISNASGNYHFTNLKPGSYMVEFSNLPAGYVFTNANAGANDAIDSDANASGVTGIVAIASTEDNLTVDAGIHAASLGNYVWLDLNRDGIQNTGDLPVAGATVRLLDQDGAELDSMATNSSGVYIFRDLAPGEYMVSFDLPIDYLFTMQNEGTNDAVDSDVDTVTGRTALVSLSAGEINDTVDAGLVYEPSSLGNFVWRDRNFNGIQDSGEAGVAGVTVNLLDSSDHSLASTVTATDGSYLFDNLNPGDYKVEFEIPDGFLVSPRDQGADDAVDSDADQTTGMTGVVTLGIGEDNLTVDAGLFELASLGDKVWVDYNRDGMQDSDEPGVGGMQVDLLDASLSVIATTTTNSSGLYLFEDLLPGNYTVQFILPSRYIFTGMDMDAGDIIDSDANTTTGRTAEVALVEGEHNTSIDAGIVPIYSIGDRVWIDDDADGIQDAGEIAMNGVTVSLLDAVTGSTLLTTVTADDLSGNPGYYLFADVPYGRYYIRMVLPSNYSITMVNQGSNDSIDSDGYIAGSSVRTESLLLNADIITIDLGLIDLAKYPNWEPPYGPVQNPKTGDFD